MKRKSQTLKNVQKVYSFWGRFPSLYDAQDMITFLGRAPFIRRKTVRMAGLKKGNSVLEVACGSGRNFKYLAQAVGTDGFVTGVDYSREMLAAAQKRCTRNGWKNIKLLRGDAARLSLPNNSFDAVISVLGISAVPGWEHALKECRRVLRRGGRLVVCDARLFTGFLKILNPLIRRVYTRFAAWEPSKNIPKKMKELFGNVHAERFNAGTFFIAVSAKRNRKNRK